jgi:hypothetical protein
VAPEFLRGEEQELVASKQQQQPGTVGRSPRQRRLPAAWDLLALATVGLQPTCAPISIILL